MAASIINAFNLIMNMNDMHFNSMPITFHFGILRFPQYHIYTTMHFEMLDNALFRILEILYHVSTASSITFTFSHRSKHSRL